MSKRNRLDVIHDILQAISEKNGKIKPTHILYKSNLSHKMMTSYLDELIEKDLIEEIPKGRSKTYEVKEKGYQFLNRYKSFKDFMESFGLEE